MAQGQVGAGPDPVPPYRRIFHGFPIALDLKNLLLPAGGIDPTAQGWGVLPYHFYTPDRPLWKDYEAKNRTADWQPFKRDRARWNLLHHLAGPPLTEGH